MVGGGCSLSGTLVGYHRCLGQITLVVFCKGQQGSRPPSSRLPTSSQNSRQDDQAFNWTLLAKYIWPDLFFFMVAVGVGILNSFNAVYLFHGPTILNVLCTAVTFSFTNFISRRVSVAH